MGRRSSSAAAGSPTNEPAVERPRERTSHATPFHLLAFAAAGVLPPLTARAHHGWSGFDQDRPLYLEGKAARCVWKNPHAELEAAPHARACACRPTWRKRAVPAQSASVDAARILAAARLPTRKDPVWELEFAPLTRMEAWKVAEIKPGQQVVGDRLCASRQRRAKRCFGSSICSRTARPTGCDRRRRDAWGRDNRRPSSPRDPRLAPPPSGLRHRLLRARRAFRPPPARCSTTSATRAGSSSRTANRRCRSPSSTAASRSATRSTCASASPRRCAASSA